MSIENYEFHTTVDEKYLDVYGHLNHTHYLTLFEDARWGYYQTKAITPDSVKNGKVGPVVLKAEISYKKEVSAGDKIRIVFKHMGYRHNLWNLRQIMYKENGKISSVADYVFGLFDLEQRKLIPPTGQWLESSKEQ